MLRGTRVASAILYVKVWLTRKHAQCIDGIDLREYKVGDTITLPRHDAWLLMAEQWAQPERRHHVDRRKQAVRPDQPRRARDR